MSLAVANGYMSGYAEGGTFGPADPMTRGQVACVFANMALRAGAVAFDPLFSDVAADAYYASNVTWAAEAGVMNGYASGSGFGPEDGLTREMMACVLRNYAKYLGMNTTVRDADAALSAYGDSAEVSDWAQFAVAWCIEQGIMGNNGSALRGTAPITRAEVAAMAVNFQPAPLAAPAGL